MSIFEIITDENNLVKRIRILNLVQDLHQILTSALVDELIISTLEMTDLKFAEYLTQCHFMYRKLD